MNIFVQVRDFKILTIDFVQSLKMCLMRKRQRMHIATRQKGEISLNSRAPSSVKVLCTSGLWL